MALPTEHDDPENSDNREAEAAELPGMGSWQPPSRRKRWSRRSPLVFGGDVVVKAVGVNIAAAVGYMPEASAFAVALANASAAAAAPAEEAAAAQDALAEQPGHAGIPEPTVEPRQMADRPEFDERPGGAADRRDERRAVTQDR